MCNISGNFNTETEEIEVVKEYLKRLNIKYLTVTKYEDRNAGDVMVTFPNGLYSLFEVKRESTKRFNKYGEYGIDFISSFEFINEGSKYFWKGIHKPNEIESFIHDIDTSKNFKWGKLYYSYSDVWLFYTKDEETGEYQHIKGYSGKLLENFSSYLFKHCCFAVNHKSSNELSHTDKHSSATFFVSPDKMKEYEITSENIYHNGNFIETLKEINKVYVIPENKYYHKENCFLLNKVPFGEVITMTETEAIEKGYKKCILCDKKINDKKTA